MNNQKGWSPLAHVTLLLCRVAPKQSTRACAEMGNPKGGTERMPENHQVSVSRLPAYDEENLVTALVPSETACFASSPGRMSRTAVWISRDVIVGFLL